jgi:hypothetical protein
MTTARACLGTSAGVPVLLFSGIVALCPGIPGDFPDIVDVFSRMVDASPGTID